MAEIEEIFPNLIGTIARLAPRQSEYITNVIISVTSKDREDILVSPLDMYVTSEDALGAIPACIKAMIGLKAVINSISLEIVELIVVDISDNEVVERFNITNKSPRYIQGLSSSVAMDYDPKLYKSSTRSYIYEQVAYSA